MDLAKPKRIAPQIAIINHKGQEHFLDLVTVFSCVTVLLALQSQHSAHSSSP